MQLSGSREVFNQSMLSSVVFKSWDPLGVSLRLILWKYASQKENGDPKKLGKHLGNALKPKRTHYMLHLNDKVQIYICWKAASL
jgi:hypothetical protein